MFAIIQLFSFGGGVADGGDPDGGGDYIVPGGVRGHRRQSGIGAAGDAQ